MKLEFYQCAHCGQIIAVVKDKGVPIMCCGEPMKELVPGAVDGAVGHDDQRVGNAQRI